SAGTHALHRHPGRVSNQPLSHSKRGGSSRDQLYDIGVWKSRADLGEPISHTHHSANVTFAKQAVVGSNRGRLAISCSRVVRAFVANDVSILCSACERSHRMSGSRAAERDLDGDDEAASPLGVVHAVHGKLFGTVILIFERIRWARLRVDKSRDLLRFFIAQ